MEQGHVYDVIDFQALDPEETIIDAQGTRLASHVISTLQCPSETQGVDGRLWAWEGCGAYEEHDYQTAYSSYAGSIGSQCVDGDDSPCNMRTIVGSGDVRGRSLAERMV